MMHVDPIHIKFRNQQRPNAAFDLLDMNAIFQRENLGHSPFQLHLVAFYLIIFIESGTGKHTIDFTDYTYKKNTILTIRKDQFHKFFKNNTAKGTVLLFTDDFLISYLEQLEALKSLQLFNEVLGAPKIQLNKKQGEETVSLINRIRQEYFHANDGYSFGIIRSELHILIAKLFRIKSQGASSGTERKYLAAFIKLQFMVEQHARRYNKVQDYADMMGLSTKTLNTITQSIVHKTAKAFIDEICTKQIKRLLINTELSIKEIAYYSGFDETTNFYKYFKRQTKITPEQFRMSLR